MFRTAYILNPRADWAWFLLLPLAATAIAMASQIWLSAVAVVSVSLWVTAPHHFATWLRAYGVREDFHHWRVPLILGPLVIGAITFGGMLWAPMSLLLLAWAWDHQHTIMQQYGFARIYDHKARSGAPSTPRFDLWLNWVLYVNLMLVSPLYSNFWVRELYRFGVPVSAEQIQTIETVSMSLTGLFLAVYAGHVVWSVRRGYSINPIKCLFIASSYFLWYFTAWWVQSVLVAKIAHAIMHGGQYIVMVHSYLRRSGGSENTFTKWLVQPRNVAFFVLMLLVYAVLYQWVTAQPWEAFGFGAIEFGSVYAEPIPELNIPGYTDRQRFELFAALMIQVIPLVHYYYDSFIWKVREDRVQAGL